MRILTFSWFYEYPYGGAEIVTRMLQRGLEARGHQVEVVCLAGGPLRQPGTVWRLGLPSVAYRFPFLTKVGFLFFFNRVFDAHFLRQLRRTRLPLAQYDHIHCQDLLSLVIASRLSREYRKPAGSTIHEIYPRYPAWSGGAHPLRRAIGLSLRLRDARVGGALRDFRWIAGVSQFITRAAGDYLAVPPERLHTVYNPVLFPREPAPAASPSPHCRLLFIGRLCKEKGIDLLLDAFTLLDASAELTILGLHGPLKDHVVRAARNHPRIRLVPAVEHQAISAFYYAHDILCLPSLCEEAFGLAVAEARTHGRAIVTTRQGGLPEVVAGYPKAVTIEVKHQTRAQIVRALADAINRARTLCAAPVDAAGENRVFGDMPVERCVEKYEALYRGESA